MSDDDASDVSPVAVPEVSPAAPEVSKGWSEQDRRTLIITVGGGLAANLGTVILVGAAIALLHQTKGTTSGELVFALIFAAVSLAIMAAGYAVSRGRAFGRPQRELSIWRYGAGWAIFIFGSLFLLEALLLLIGLASGVK